MAFNQKYVSVSGGGLHDGSSEANAWTFSEMLSNATAGDYANVKSGAYSSGAASLSNAGTAWGSGTMIFVAGYNTTPGDLDDQGRVEERLDTTNFPIITLTGQLTPNSWSHWKNLRITGSVSGVLFGGSAIDNATIEHCSIENTANNSAAQAVELDDDPRILNSDILCSGASHGTVCESDTDGYIQGNYFKSTDSAATVVDCRAFDFSKNMVWSAGGVGVDWTAMSNIGMYVKNNTVYGASRGFQFSAPEVYVHIENNHITDCGVKYYCDTGTAFLQTFFERTRDNTTAEVDIESDSINVGAVTTDTGGPSTDYVDYTNGDIRLISSAPGKDSGLGIANP